MTAIDIKSLTKKYGDLIAVDSLDLKIEEGETFALLGVNGAGKTTTIRMLACLTKPSGGDALLLGDSICRDSEAVKSKTGISPQETAVAPKLTVRENLEFMAGIYGLCGSEARQRADRMIEEFGLKSVERKRARTLSGGWQRRLSIAMSLMGSPRILFMDEPTIGLDVIARRELRSEIKKLHGKTTILLTTHYMDEAEALADRIGIMSHGKLHAVGTAGELKTLTGTNTLEDAFVSLAGGEELGE